MGFLAIAKVIVLAAVTGQPVAPAAMQPPKLPEPITTRQNFFAIPFRIQPANLPQQEAVEAQLYVSGDRGKTWQLYSRVDPTERQFLFRSACDGEFWFIVRTLDRSNQVRPAGVQGPEMRVVVDTVPPVLSLDAKAGQGGQVTAKWQVDEAHPKLDTLNIQYRTSSTEPWQTVAIDRREEPSDRVVYSGEATWLPGVAGDSIEIRAEIADAAGNSAVSHAQLQLPRDAADPKPDEVPKTTEPAAPVASVAVPEAGAIATSPDALAENSPIRPRDAAVAATASPAYQNRYDDRAANSATGAAAAPAAARDWPYWVQKKLFDLNYDVTSVGPSGLGRVEIWGTRDAGRSWKCFAVDSDNVTPVSVGVDAEGVYGFRVVMQSRSGAGGEPPKSGDMPELWIGVDCTQPVAKIVAAQQGSGPDCGTLNISWHASDQNLAAKPIALFYSEQPSGPWTPIAVGLENTGGYVWTLPQQLSTQVFLRIEASDMAGNVGIGQSVEPVRLNPMRVSAEAIKTPSPQLPVAPPVEASRVEPRRYYFK